MFLCELSFVCWCVEKTISLLPVDIDHDSAEEHKPQILVALRGEAVVDDENAVRHPQGREQPHHHRQHLDHLQRERATRGVIKLNKNGSSRCVNERETWRSICPGRKDLSIPPCCV